MKLNFAIDLELHSRIMEAWNTIRIPVGKKSLPLNPKMSTPLSNVCK